VGQAALMVQAEDGETLAEAIKTLLADSGLRKDLVGKGLSRAAEFTWRASGEKLLSVYERLDARGFS
jgi:glycosyltransferase involved in cell wall biosynthesis